jgi:hypothetical protein
VWQHAGAAARVGAVDVEEAVSRVWEASRAAFEWIWDGWPPGARLAAAALAQAGAGLAMSDEDLHALLHQHGVRVLIRDTREAPRLLEDWGLIESSPVGHRFRVELLRQWIVKFRPLAGVPKEIDRIEPLADNLYQAAIGFYRDGKVNEASKLLRQAIELNSSHVGASELLADLLIGKQDWEGARGLPAAPAP